MAIFRNWSTLLLAAIAGLAFTSFLLWLKGWYDFGSDCEIVTQIFDRPGNALLGTPRGDPISPRGTFYFDSGCDYSDELPGVVLVWLTFWLPLLFAWFGTGYLAARLAARMSLFRCVLAGAFAASAQFGYALVYEFGLQDYYGYTEDHRLYPQFAFCVLIAITAVGGAVALAGGWTYRRLTEETDLGRPFAGATRLPGE